MLQSDRAQEDTISYLFRLHVTGHLNVLNRPEFQFNLFGAYFYDFYFSQNML